MKTTRLATFEAYKKRALKEEGLRRALARPGDDPFLDVAYGLIMLRRELSLTQAQLAKRLRVSQQSLARLESLNYKGHSLRSLDRIARACGRRLRVEFAKA